eukprot:364429-Chlamydomonas_euryale.AAC.21
MTRSMYNHAVLQARVRRLVYGCRQPRIGADGSWIAMFHRAAGGAEESTIRDVNSGARESAIRDGNSGVQESAIGDGSLSGSGGVYSRSTNGTTSEGVARSAGCADGAGVEGAPMPAALAASHPRMQQTACPCCNALDPRNVLGIHGSPLAPSAPHPFHPDVSVTGGYRADECGALLKQFFAKRRQQSAAAKQGAGAAAVARPEPNVHDNNLPHQSQTQLGHNQK